MTVIFVKFIFYILSLLLLSIATFGVIFRLPDTALFFYVLSFVLWVLPDFIPERKNK